MPAWRSPRNAIGWCRSLRSVLAADARPARAPAPAAPTTAAVTPAAPNSWRRDRPSRGGSGSAAGVSGSLGSDDTLHLAYLLGQRVDRARQLLALRLGHLVVEHETVALAVLLEQRVDLGEPLVHLLAEVSVALIEDGPHRRHRRLRSVDVGLEVPQVGVAEGVLLAGDLAARHLVEQTLCATGDLGRVDGPSGRLYAVV